MGKQDGDDDWLYEPIDDAAFERTLEGETILGTGGPFKEDEVLRLSESDDE